MEWKGRSTCAHTTLQEVERDPAALLLPVPLMQTTDLATGPVRSGQQLPKAGSLLVPGADRDRTSCFARARALAGCLGGGEL